MKLYGFSPKFDSRACSSDIAIRAKDIRKKSVMATGFCASGRMIFQSSELVLRARRGEIPSKNINHICVNI